MRHLALISGGGSGIGLAAAKLFIKNGWDIIVIGRRREPLEALKAKYPENAHAIACDLTSSAQVEGLKLKIENGPQYHSLKCLVNNAGQYVQAKFQDTTDGVWQNLFEVNFFGSIRLTRALLPTLLRNHGNIVNVSSTLGLRPSPSTLAYSATKAAMISWTQGLALELAPDVRVNAVCPGLVDTPIHKFHQLGPEQLAAEKKKLGPIQPLGRIGEAEEIAEAIYFLGSEQSSWTTGSTLSVDGGIHLT